MESASKQISGECFLKIGTYWSEAEENFESIAIKEEIVSDVEPEASEDKDENISNGGCVKSKHSEKKCDGNIFAGNPPTGPRLSLHKTLKNKSHGNPNCTSIQLELPNDTKLSCLHETKSFKIVNRRLRCGTCRSLVCPECFKVMHSTLHNHFLGFDTSNYSIYACKFCSFPFPSVCALQVTIITLKITKFFLLDVNANNNILLGSCQDSHNGYSICLSRLWTHLQQCLLSHITPDK